jgi:hypothetical protein
MICVKFTSTRRLVHERANVVVRPAGTANRGANPNIPNWHVQLASGR